MKITKKIMSIVLAAFMVIGSLAVSVSADSLFDSAVKLPSGKKQTFTLASNGKKDYKVTLSKKGTLTVNITSRTARTAIHLYDSAGKKIDAIDVTSVAGSLDGDYRTPIYLSWDNVVEEYSGKIQYELNKGTYYIRIVRDRNSGSGKVNLTATYPSKDDDGSSGKISYLTLEMEAGDTLRLGAVAEPADAEIKWTSSKTNVATVSASGKVTAKKEGSTIITAKSGSSSVKIKINVV